MELADIDAVETALAGQDYVCSRPLATVAFLALKLGRPLFLEGEAGTGKTEIAKAIAAALGRRLIRLQCYEGLDAANALADWNFAAQMIAIRTAEAAGAVVMSIPSRLVPDMIPTYKGDITDPARRAG